MGGNARRNIQSYLWDVTLARARHASIGSIRLLVSRPGQLGDIWSLCRRQAVRAHFKDARIVFLSDRQQGRSGFWQRCPRWDRIGRPIREILHSTSGYPGLGYFSRWLGYGSMCGKEEVMQLVISLPRYASPAKSSGQSIL